MQHISPVGAGLSRRQNQQPLEGDCPNGGNWYACNDPGGLKFVGCCTVNPCTNVGCAAGNIRGAGMGDLAYGSTPDQDCLAGLFYTCTGGATFWGCCKTNPCSNPAGVGCPRESLASASLILVGNNPFVEQSDQETDPETETPTVTRPTTLSTVAPPSSSSISTTTSSNPSSTVSSVSLPDSPTADSTGSLSSSTNTLQSSQVPAQNGGISTGLIAGVAVGGFVLALLCVGLILLFCRRRKRRQTKSQIDPPTLPMVDAPPKPGHTRDTSLASTLVPTSPVFPQPGDSFYDGTPAAYKPFPPSAYSGAQSPPLPQYRERRESYEIGGTEIANFARPNYGYQNGVAQHAYGHSRQRSYELVGTPMMATPGTPGTVNYPNSPPRPGQIVSELPTGANENYINTSQQNGYNQPLYPGDGTGLGLRHHNQI